MKCIWTPDASRASDPPTWRRVKCARRNCRWNGLPQAPPPDDTIHVDCTGWPNDDEPELWVEHFAETLNLPRPQAICEFIRWRADGADLSELLGPLVVQTEQPPQHGPGTELKKLLDSLGIQPTASCQCAARQAEMNALGPKGCCREKEKILGWLRESYNEADALTKLRAGAEALTQGLPLTLEGLLDEVIRRAQLHRAAQ